MRAISLLAGVTLVAASCGDDDDTADTAGDTTAGQVTTAAPTAAPTTATGDTTATTVETATTPAATDEPTGTTAFVPPERGDADLVIWADETRAPVIEEVAVPFAEENGITVAVQQIDFGQIREQISLAAPGGEGPDIVIGAHDWLGELVSNGVVEPLDLGDMAAGFQDVAIDAFTYEGQVYGLPYAVENVALVRNTDLAPDVPATFEEMVQIATDYKAEHGNDPSALGLAVQVGTEGDGYHLQPILSAFGGYIFAQNDDGTFNPDDLGLDSPGAIGAARFLSESADSGLLSADVTYDVMIESFGSGNAPFAITGPWAISQADNGFKATGVPYAVSPIPAREAGDAPQVFVGVQGFMISSFSEQKDLAKTFVLDFMSQESTQLAMFEAGGRPPALTSAFEKVSSDADVAGFGESGAAGIPQPAIPEMSNVWTTLGLAEINVLQGAPPAPEFRNAAEAIREEIAG